MSEPVRLRLVVALSVEAPALARLFAADVGRVTGLTESQVADLRIAVSEAVTAALGDEPDEVEVVATVAADSLTIGLPWPTSAEADLPRAVISDLAGDASFDTPGRVTIVFPVPVDA